MRKSQILRNVNKALNDIGKSYYACIPLDKIKSILESHGLELENGIYCGSGETFEPVGQDIYLRLSWYQMQSGNYEITAYAS